VDISLKLAGKSGRLLQVLPILACVDLHRHKTELLFTSCFLLTSRTLMVSQSEVLCSWHVWN